MDSWVTMCGLRSPATNQRQLTLSIEARRIVRSVDLSVELRRIFADAPDHRRSSEELSD